MFVADLPGVPTGRDALATLCDPFGVRDVRVLWCCALGGLETRYGAYRGIKTW